MRRHEARRPLRSSNRFGVWLAVLAVACSPGPHEPGPTDAGVDLARPDAGSVLPFPATHAQLASLRRIAALRCAMSARCALDPPNPLAVSDLPVSDEGCRDRELLDLLSDDALPGVVAGTRVIDDAAIDACEAAAAADPCAPDAACPPMIAPAQQNGEACRVSGDCRSGNCAEGPVGASCRVCAEGKASGAVCSEYDFDCGRGISGHKMTCASNGTEDVCREWPRAAVGLGEACDGRFLVQCAEGLYCASDSTCRPWARVDEPCDSSAESCVPGSVCVSRYGAPLCTAWTVATGTLTPCGTSTSSGPVRCDDTAGLACDQDLRVCVDAKGTGQTGAPCMALEDCATGLTCIVPLFASGTGVCGRANQGLGTECIGNLSCASLLCRPVGGVFRCVAEACR